MACSRSSFPVGADCFRELIAYNVKLPLAISPSIKNSGVIKIIFTAKANLTQVKEYFDVYSHYNQLKIANLCVPVYIYIQENF